MIERKRKVPWYPIGNRTDTKNPFPERRGKMGDDPNIEETFQPAINPTSEELIQKGMLGKTFLERYKSDIAFRCQNRKVKNVDKQQYFSE